MTSAVSVEIDARNLPTAVSGALLAGNDGNRSDRPGAIKLSELYRPPSAYRTFPESARLIEEVRTWLLRYIEPLGCGRRLVRPIDETVTMCPSLFPDADYEGNCLATIFTALEFVNDDIFDSLDVYDTFRASAPGQRLANELLAIRSNPSILGQGMMAIVNLVRDPEAGACSLALPDDISGDLFLYSAFRAFAYRLHAFGQRTGSPNFRFWLDTFTDALIHFGRSHTEIYKSIDRQSIEEYTTHKLVNCGMLHTVLLLELAMGCFLSREQHALPLIDSLMRNCIYVGSLLNEITSFEKEVFDERSGNLLLVVMLKERCDLRQATQYVASLAQRHADEVGRLRERACIEFAGDDEQSQLLRRYASGIDQLTAACWYWQLAGTTRYQSAKSPFAELLVIP